MTHLHLHRPLALLIIALLLAAPSLAGETRFEQERADGGKALLIFARSPLETMTEVPFRVVLTDPAGNAIADADLRLDLDMPAMPMPPNKPQALWQNDAYHGVAIFTMAGEWTADLQIARPGQAAETIGFNLGVVRMK
ncbi:MAG: FixH family protein [Desulfuromonadales bacterium]|nr:FixH family protein [Desulfuromonadales bacterium]